MPKSTSRRALLRTASVKGMLLMTLDEKYTRMPGDKDARGQVRPVPWHVQRYNKKHKLQHVFPTFYCAFFAQKLGLSESFVILQTVIAAAAATTIF